MNGVVPALVSLYVVNFLITRVVTSPDLVQRSYTTSDGTNRILVKFYNIFWCSSFLYDKS